MASDTTPAIIKNEDTPRGFAFGLTAYFLWGFLPFYLKAVAHIPSLEVLAHRALWSVPVAGIVLVALRRTADLKVALKTPRMLGMACLTATIIMVNWGIYVWAVAAGRALDAALGYFINPLFSVFLAAIILKEKLAPAQLVAIGLVVVAVTVLTIDAGGLPWVSIGLTVTWGFYALFRKTLPIGPNQGFFLEVLLISIPCLPYVVWLEATGQGHLLHSTGWDTFILAIAGVVTAVPLMVYANGAKLLTLSTIAIMQYIAPTMIFLIAVFAFHEPLSLVKLGAFVLIWAALAIYTWSMLRQVRGRSL
ncbi:EamA family transporter RarD [Neorhizobium petrolearium]|uniref:EamA family transporter RarD n=1 Tax=Neorhizobium petrolearium TaxID=515361 RepID=A0ABY8M994_9HYPH|nr:EamA family transporter RarD [Neorhizobium petrolearium]MCC2609179.1 EamA family transporter RarD [Neorhizobium petrolearium]WGI71088.1 EamA family transporter RarD [Neorhizobium petrolearium]